LTIYLEFAQLFIIFDHMSDIKRFDHFLKKVYEGLHLHFRHYMPLGKPEPIWYRELFYQIYKLYDSGILEEISKEPVIDEEVQQLDMFQQQIKLTDSQNKQLGTELDKDKTKKP